MHWDANLWQVAEWKMIKHFNLPIIGGWRDTPEPQLEHYSPFSVGSWGRGPLIQLWLWVWRSVERSRTSICLFIVAFRALSSWTLMVQTVQTESQCPQSVFLTESGKTSSSTCLCCLTSVETRRLSRSAPRTALLWEILRKSCFFGWALKSCCAQGQQTSFHLWPPESWNHLPVEGKSRCTQVQLSLLHVQMKTSLTDSACNRNQALCSGVTTSHKETTAAGGKKRPAGEGNERAPARGSGRMKTQQRRPSALGKHTNTRWLKVLCSG